MATWPTIIDDDGTGTTGTIFNKAFFDQFRAYIDDVGMGAAWTPVTYNGASFGAGGSMVWTVEAGDILMNRYRLSGKTLFWSCYLFTTSTSGTASSELRINLPIPGAQAASPRFLMPVAFIGDGGTNVTGYAETKGLTYITINKTNLAAYTIASNALHLAFTIFFEIV